jgi:PAS domain S-box-containing protein
MPPSAIPVNEDPAAVTAPASIERRPARRPFGNRTRTIYYLLVAFNLLTVLVSGYLNNELGNAERHTLEKNERRAAQLARISDLELAAGAVDAPGNDIFASLDPEGERARLQIATARFRGAMRAARAEMGGDPRLLAELRAADRRLSRMLNDSEEISVLVEQKQIGNAARSMVTMDRDYTELRTGLAAARTYLRDLQLADFRKASVHSRRLAHQQAVSVALIAVLVVVLVAYGRRIDQEMITSQERERYVETLHDKKTALRLALAQRDARTEELIHNQEILFEAQRIAGMGSWEWNVISGKVRWSDGLFRLVGHEPAAVEATYAAYMDTIVPADLERVASRLAQALDDHAPFEHEYAILLPNGERRVHRTAVRLDLGAGNTVLRMFGVVQDVTDRRKAENDLRLSEERFHLASQATNDVIWDVDLINGQVWVNESFASHFGYPQWGDIDSAVWLAAVHPEDVERVRAGYREAIERQATTWNVQYRLAAFGGQWHDVLYRGHIVRGHDGKAVRLIGAMMDISERRAIDRMKDEFISTVSHELRTPLTSIRGALGLLSSGRLGTLPEKGQRLLDIASSNTDRLVRLINDILDIERIESGQVTLTKSSCDAGVLARTAADVVRALADRENIRITIDAAHVPLVADGDRMIQTLTNLLGNAVKFSPAGSLIRLTVRSEGSNVLFSVTDQGRGIPAEKLGTIFERFQQVDASDSRDKGGSGLGLTICRSIVRQHGGEIHVESEPGRGSTFTVTVPAGLPLLEADRRIAGRHDPRNAGTEGASTDAA